MNTAPAPLVTLNTDGSDSEYMPSDMAPLGFDEVASGLIWLCLVVAFAIVVLAGAIVKWLL